MDKIFAEPEMIDGHAAYHVYDEDILPVSTYPWVDVPTEGFTQHDELQREWNRLSNGTDSDQDELMYRIRNQFIYFLAYAYMHMGFKPPTPVQCRLAYLMDNTQYFPHYAVLIESLRGVGKSVIVRIFACYQLLHDKT